MKNIKIKIKILKWFPRYREYLLTNSNVMAGHFQAEPTSAYSLVWEYCPCCVRVEQLIATSGKRNFFKVFDAMRRCPIFNLFCRRNDLSDLLSRHYQLINSRGFSRLPVLPPSPTIPLQRSWPRRWLWHNRRPPPPISDQAGGYGWLVSDVKLTSLSVSASSCGNRKRGASSTDLCPRQHSITFQETSGSSLHQEIPSVR